MEFMSEKKYRTKKGMKSTLIVTGTEYCRELLRCQSVHLVLI